MKSYTKFLLIEDGSVDAERLIEDLNIHNPEIKVICYRQGGEPPKLIEIKECGRIIKTASEREEIFNKECLTIADFQILFGVGYHDAARIIRNIRRRCDRLHIEGRIHTQDYFDYFELKTDRYIFNKKKPDEENLPD